MNELKVIDGSKDLITYTINTPIYTQNELKKKLIFIMKSGFFKRSQLKSQIIFVRGNGVVFLFTDISNVFLM